jgi:type IV secretory pathway VirB10-like protein
MSRSQTARKAAPDELYSTEHHNVAGGLSTLPRDYAGLPKGVPGLGPPLLRELGGPILAAQGQAAATVPDPDLQQLEQEIEAARVSRLFASTKLAGHAAAGQDISDRRSRSSPFNPDDISTQIGQGHKLAFVNASVDRRTTSPDCLTRPASPYGAQAGTVPGRPDHPHPLGPAGTDHSTGD